MAVTGHDISKAIEPVNGRLERADAARLWAVANYLAERLDKNDSGNFDRELLAYDAVTANIYAEFRVVVRLPRDHDKAWAYVERARKVYEHLHEDYIFERDVAGASARKLRDLFTAAEIARKAFRRTHFVFRERQRLEDRRRRCRERLAQEGLAT